MSDSECEPGMSASVPRAPPMAPPLTPHHQHQHQLQLMSPPMHGVIAHTPSPVRYSGGSAYDGSPAAPLALGSSSPLLSSSVSTATTPSFSSLAAPADDDGLDGNYMLLEYAAQLKGLSQRSVVRGVRRLRHVPRDVRQAWQSVRSEATRVLALVRQEIEEMASGRAAQQAKLARLQSSHSFLQAATELLDQADQAQVTKATKRRQSGHFNQHQQSRMQPQTPQAPSLAAPAATPSAEAQDAVSSLASFMSSLNAAASPAPSPAAADSATPPADANKFAELASMVQALSAQMAAMKGPASGAMAVQAPGGAVASVGPAVPLAPSMSPRGLVSAASSIPVAPKIAANIPQAPALSPDSFFFTGVHASEKQNDLPAVPECPPAPSAPTVTAAAPSMGRAGILGEITNRTSVLQPVNRRKSNGRSQSVIEVRAKQAPPTIQCYTRRIPGSESMSLTDSIRVASRIKLRRTDGERSPGGTPSKAQRVLTSSSSTQDVLQAALSARFKNIHLDAAASKQTRSHSVMLQSPPSLGKRATAPTPLSPIMATSAAQARDSFGGSRRNSIDKENWETA